MRETDPPRAPAPTRTSKPDRIDEGGRGLTSRYDPLRGLITKVARGFKRLRGPVVAIAAVGAVLSGFVGYWNAYRTVRDSPAPPAMKTTSPANAVAFSIAVLPFVAAPNDQTLADRVTQEITIALKRNAPYLTVVSGSGQAAEGSQAVDTRFIGRERNVRYVLAGNVQLDGDNVKIAARLINAESGSQTWVGQFDAARSQLFAQSDTASWAFIRDLRGALWRAEEQRVSHGPSRGASTPGDLVLRASVLERHRTPQRLAEAARLVDEALRLDPNSVLALSERALINEYIWENDPSEDRLKLALESDELARRALAIDRTDPEIWRRRAWALGMQGRWDAAEDAMTEAHRLDPSHLSYAVGRIWMLSMMGRADEALRFADEALAREPSLDADPNFRHNQCYAQLLLGMFDKAVKSCEKSAAGGDDWWPYFFVTIAYAQSDDMARAAASKAELLRRRPDFTIARFNAMGLSDNPLYLKQAEANIIPGMRKAGIPEK